jgi:hypothetical protein
MAMHVIIGWVVLVAALISAGVVVTVISVALRSLNRKGGSEIPGQSFVSPTLDCPPNKAV